MAGSVEKIYAKALLEIAAEDGSAKELNEELTALSGIASANPELIQVLCAPTITDGEKLSIIENVFKGRVCDIIYNFLCVITEKNRFGYLPQIAEEFKDGYYEMSGIAEVTVTTVIPLKDDARAKLSKKLAAMYGKEIIMKEKIDPSIIGGMIVTYGDNMLDGSVKTKLDKMHGQIKGMIAG